MKLSKYLCSAAIAATLVFGTGATLPITSAIAQEVSESHLAAAKRAIVASRSTNSLDQILPRMANELKGELIRNRPDQEAQISLIVDEAAISIAGRRGDLENEASQIFTRVFSEEELIAVATFFESPAGIKFLEQSPLVLREIQRAAQVWSAGMRRDLGEAVQTRMQAVGLAQ